MHKPAHALTFVLVLLIAPVVAGPAVASGPGPGVTTAGRKVCKGGADAGAPCNTDGDCVKNKCVLNLVKGKKINAVLTVFYDPHTRDWRDEDDLDFKALNVVLDFKYKGQAHLLAETYMQNSGASDPPKIGSAWGAAAATEAFFTSFTDPTFCEFLVLSYPDAKLAEALLAVVGLPTTNRPIITKAKQLGVFDHTAVGDDLGTAGKCKVQFTFLNDEMF